MESKSVHKLSLLPLERRKRVPAMEAPHSYSLLLLSSFERDLLSPSGNLPGADIGSTGTLISGKK